MYDVPICSDFLWMANLLNTCYGTFPWVWCLCQVPHRQLWRCQLRLFSASSSIHYEPNFRGFILKNCAQLDFLFTSFICSRSVCEYSNNQVTPSFGLCLCANSRLCCMHFSYHWCKICHVLRQLMQITQRLTPDLHWKIFHWVLQSNVV